MTFGKVKKVDGLLLQALIHRNTPPPEPNYGGSKKHMDGLEADGAAQFCFALVSAPHGRRGSSHLTHAQSSATEIKNSLTPKDQTRPDYLQKCLI